MICDLCKTRKLRREFPLDTVTDICDHAPLHCLRVSQRILPAMCIKSSYSQEFSG